MSKAKSQNKAARKRDRGDRSREYELRNIRRRFQRQAARYELQAESAEPMDRKQLLAGARALRAEAEKYYAANITQARRGSEAYNADLNLAVSVGHEPSLRQLATAVDTEQEQRERLTRTITNSTAGDAFYASVIQIWDSQPYEQRDQVIVSAFQEAHPDMEVRDVLDVMNIMEEATGIPFTSPDWGSGEEAEQNYRMRSRRGMLYVMDAFND